jgi:hypothetical protein
MRIEILIILLILSPASLKMEALAQQVTTSEPAGFIRRYGWAIPQVTKRTSEERVVWKKVGDDDLKTIYYTRIEPEGIVALYDTKSYRTDTKGRKKIYPDPMRASTVGVYDVDGKVFCYTFYGVRIRIFKTEDGGSAAVAVCCYTGFAFYDDDGDGKFERMIHAPDPASFKLYVPAWVLEGKVNRA